MQKHFMCLSRGVASDDVDWCFPADVVEGWEMGPLVCVASLRLCDALALR
jgi:hypothetical protein